MDETRLQNSFPRASIDLRVNENSIINQNEENKLEYQNTSSHKDYSNELAKEILISNSSSLHDIDIRRISQEKLAQFNPEGSRKKKNQEKREKQRSAVIQNFSSSHIYRPRCSNSIKIEQPKNIRLAIEKASTSQITPIEKSFQ
jgi:hypothetical protein